MDAKTSEFGILLRLWRTERRLSQSELAMAAETPSRHISFLETGRANPSRNMVERLSVALDIPLRERNQLFRAAGFADLAIGRSLAEDELAMLRSAVMLMMTAHDPYPSLVINRSWEIVDANGSARRLLAMVEEHFPLDRTDAPVSLFDLMLSPNGLRPYIANWEDYARQLIQRVYRETLSPMDLRRCLKRIGEFPDIPVDWWSLDVRYRVAPVFAVNLALGELSLSFFSVIASIAAPREILAEELRVETMFPADIPTDKYLRMSVVDPAPHPANSRSIDTAFNPDNSDTTS